MVESKPKRSRPPRAEPARNTSWVPGRKGQGGEGLSKGHGGSRGPGLGPSGPEEPEPRHSKRDAITRKRATGAGKQ
jgi:hypothetical protein